MNDKYELINKQPNGLYQIRALKDFSNVSKGDLGGFIEQENNLSVDGNAWVSDNAEVYGDARVFGNARVSGNAWVSGNLEVSGNARVSGNVLNLSYDKYNITITDKHIRIGCQQHTICEWFGFTDDVIDAMDTGALVWWKQWKPVLELMVEIKQNKERDI